MLGNVELIELHHVDQVRRGLMPSSVECRDQRLGIFAESLGEQSMLDASRDDIETFLDARLIGARTRYSWLSHLHSFYVWALREDLTLADPTSRIVRPKMRRALPRPADTGQLRLALDHADGPHRAWLLLGAFMGLRCQEIAGLRVEDVIESEHLLRVTKGKGGVERLLPLHPDVLQALHDLPMPSRGWIFLRPKKGGPYTPAQMSVAINRFLRAEGVNATAHQLRHWFGTNLYNTCHDIRVTQEMLGHANPATTAIYTAYDVRAAAAAVNSISFAPMPVPKTTTTPDQ